MLNNVEAVLFDLDGTLLDTANDLGEALNFVLKNHNFPEVSEECYRPVASNGALGLLSLGFGEHLNDYHYDTLRDSLLNYYEGNIARHTCLYPGVETLLLQLNQLSIPWGIVTNKPEGLSKKLIQHFSVFSHNKILIGGDTLTKRKPDPAPILYACEKLKVKAKKCLYIGDALRDIEAGNAASLKTIIAHWGYIASTDDCTTWQADHIIETAQEILEINL